MCRYLCVRIYAAPKGVENRDTKRGLKIVGYKGEVGMEILMRVGTKDILIGMLNDESFIDDLIECAFKLNDRLRDL